MLYPIVFTVWVAFTNYGEAHLITKQQAINQILQDARADVEEPEPDDSGTGGAW